MKRQYADYETRQTRLDIIRMYRRSGRLLNSTERRGKVCVVCGHSWCKYELTLYLETDVDPEFFALEAGHVYACDLCYDKISRV